MRGSLESLIRETTGDIDTCVDFRDQAIKSGNEYQRAYMEGKISAMGIVLNALLTILTKHIGE